MTENKSRYKNRNKNKIRINGRKQNENRYQITKQNQIATGNRGNGRKEIPRRSVV